MHVCYLGGYMGGYINTSKRSDWNTNARDVSLVRSVLGRIHTDPCSNASSTVGAVVEYTEEQDGLRQQWLHNFFCNPSFGRIATLFFQRGWSEIESGRCTEGIFLVPARTDTRCFHAYVLQADSICMVRGRRTFARAKGPAPFPVMFVYRGPNMATFERQFRREGVFMRPSAEQRLRAREYADTLRGMTKVKSTDKASDHLLLTELEAYIQRVVWEFLQAGRSSVPAKAKASAKRKTVSAKAKRKTVPVPEGGALHARDVAKAFRKLCPKKPPNARQGMDLPDVQEYGCSMIQIRDAMGIRPEDKKGQLDLRRKLLGLAEAAVAGATRARVYYRIHKGS